MQDIFGRSKSSQTLNGGIKRTEPTDTFDLNGLQLFLVISCTCGQEAGGLKSTLKAKTIDPNRVQGPRRLHRSCKADPSKPQPLGLIQSVEHEKP